jgi:hypothetical protein
MAAVPGVGVVVFPLASPELALVDADLAAELRRGLRLVEDSEPRPRASLEEAPAADGTDGSPQRVVDEPSVAESERAERVDDDVYVVEVEETPPQGQGTSSHYPVLPAPEPGAESTDDTDAALRRIRERLDDDASSATRRIWG